MEKLLKLLESAPKPNDSQPPSVPPSLLPHLERLLEMLTRALAKPAELASLPPAALDKHESLLDRLLSGAKSLLPNLLKVLPSLVSML